MSRNNPLWPSEQLVLTADTSKGRGAVLHPSCQLKFMRDISGFVGSAIFADSLVYSTSEDNTGWTAFRMGANGHVSYHHWDQASPNLLQLDLFSLGLLDLTPLLQVVRSLWHPTGQRISLIRREHPDRPLQIKEQTDDVLVRTEVHRGLGPGDHLHLIVDQIASIASDVNESSLNSALVDLVLKLGMRCMTAVNSRWTSHRDSFAYDAIVGITTSHLSLRARGAEGSVSLSLDAFSCRNFDPVIVTAWLDALFTNVRSRRAVLYNRHPVGSWVTLV
jgi:hypothetical protein